MRVSRIGGLAVQFFRVCRMLCIAGCGVASAAVCGIWIYAACLSPSPGVARIAGIGFDGLVVPFEASTVHADVSLDLEADLCSFSLLLSRYTLSPDLKDRSAAAFWAAMELKDSRAQQAHEHRFPLLLRATGWTCLGISVVRAPYQPRLDPYTGVQQTDSFLIVITRWWFLAAATAFPWLLHLPFAAPGWARRFRGKAGHCSKCQYNLAGLPPGAACPECGRESADGWGDVSGG